MGTWEFPVCILGRDGRVLGSAVHAISDGSSPRNTRKNASSTLRPNHLGPRRFLPSKRRLTICHVTRPDRRLAFRIAERTRGHRGKIRPSIPRRCGRYRLRVALGIGSWRQQAMRRLKLLRLLGLWWLLVGVSEERGWRKAVHGRVRCYGCGRSRVDIMSSRRGKPRHVRPVRLAHIRMRCRRLAMMRLQRRQRMRLRNRVLRLHRVLRHVHTR